MSKTTKFFIPFFITLVLVLAIVPMINVVTDYSRVFHRDYHYLYKETRENTGFLKVSYLLEHSRDYDSVLFGSSRARFGFNAVALNDKIGGKWFKMWYPGGVPYQHYHTLRALISNGFIPKQVIISLNDFDMWTTDGAQKFNTNYNRRLYPVSILEWLSFYHFYLYKKPGKVEFEILQGKTRLRKSNRILGEKYGFSASKNQNEKSKKASFLARPPYHAHMANKNYNFTDSLQYISKIVELCKKKGIDLYLVNLVSPLKILTARNFDDIESFKKQLVLLHDFYDFSGSYKVANNPMNWFEMSHFDRQLGTKMIEAISQKRNSGQFGSFVTKENVTVHLKAVKKDVLRDLPALLSQDATTIVSESLLNRASHLPINLLGSPFFIGDGNNQHWQAHGGATYTVKIPLDKLAYSNYVVRIDVTVKNKGAILIHSQHKQLIAKKLKKGKNQLFVYIASTDLADGLRIRIKGEKANQTLKTLTVFTLAHE